MTITPGDVFQQLRRAWPDVQPGEIQPLHGGFWATMYRVAVVGQPQGIPNDLVVRFAPSHIMGAKEAEVQHEVAAQGFPTPRIHLSAGDTERDGWWSAMDFSPGSPLLSDLDGAAAVRRLPELYRSLPGQLAETMAALHQLDPAPITTAIKRAAPDVAWTVDDVLENLDSGARDAGLSAVANAIDQLATTRPSSEREVVCHGDLHPLNLLTTAGERVLVDWTGAVVAEPAYDVAFTELLLANPPIAMPRPLTPVARFAGRRLASRFIDHYSRANPPASLVNLAWFRAVHSSRVLVEIATLRQRHGPDAGGHPWQFVAAIAAKHLEAVTGVGDLDKDGVTAR